MCGIAGIWGQTPEPARLAAMAKAMHHRGPDDSGVFHDDKAGLCMARLAVIDLSTAAHQPMTGPDGMVTLVYNGETYNFLELRKGLENRGHSFNSTSDTEVVLKAYLEYGDDFLLKLRGMFALAIYDRRRGPGRERLLLARDHLGIKPLVYCRAGGNLVFASELKALLASGLVEPRLSPESLRLLLTFGSVYQPRTMLEGVSMLPPGHCLIADAGDEKLEQYWRMQSGAIPELARMSYREQKAEVARRLEESLRLQLVSDVPIGAFLSGGVDSSYMVALMAKAAGGRVKTFSVGFPAGGSHPDESREAEATARYLGTEHTNVYVSGEEVRDSLEHFVSGLDQPSVDGLNSYFVSKAARQQVTVAISGTGGDELFAGYPWFGQMVQHARRAAPGLLGNIKKRLGLGGGASDVQKDFLTAYGYTYLIFGPEGAGVTLAEGMKEQALVDRPVREDLAHLDLLPEADTIARASALCLAGYTGNQLLRDIDAVSMCHSLEVRVPYLDVPLLDMALSLPPGTKIKKISQKTDTLTVTYRDSGSKRILIDAGRDLGLLPPDIDDQPKRGFSMPFGEYLTGPLREIMEDTFSEKSLASRGWLDPAQARYLRKGFLDGQLSWAHVWLPMVLELWGRQVLDSAA